MSNSYLEISRVGIEFPTDNEPFRALENVNLAINKGEFISLIGHSGCGKSTVLNIVAGLYKATEGGVILEGREVDQPGPDRAVVHASPKVAGHMLRARDHFTRSSIFPVKKLWSSPASPSSPIFFESPSNGILAIMLPLLQLQFGLQAQHA